MKKTRFTREQIGSVLKPHEAGRQVLALVQEMAQAACTYNPQAFRVGPKSLASSESAPISSWSSPMASNTA